MIALVLAVTLLDGAGDALTGEVLVDGRHCAANDCALEPGRHVLTLAGESHAFYLAPERVVVRALPAADFQAYGVGMRREVALPPVPTLPDFSPDDLQILAYQLPGALPSHLRVARHAENNCSNPVLRIDTVPLESYVAGVVHGEIGIFRAAGTGDGVQIPREQVGARVVASFETFALAARTYAVWWYLRKGAQAEFHIHDGPCNQVYQDARDPVSEQAAQSTAGRILVPRRDLGEIEKHEYASSCARHGTLPSYRNAHDVRREDIVPDNGLDPVCVRNWCGHNNYQMAHQDNPFVEAGNRCLVRGICQWGSLERSVRGDSHTEILRHYQPDLVIHEPGSDVSVGELRGEIVDRDETGLAGARIIVSSGDEEQTEFADGSGTYGFVDLSAGEWDVQVDAQGYQRTRHTVRVVAGDTTHHRFVLQRLGVRPDAGVAPPPSDSGAVAPRSDLGSLPRADGGVQTSDRSVALSDAGPRSKPPEPAGGCGCVGPSLAEGLWIFALICLRRRRRQA